MKYRPEIDGLRAIAVVPVILFHAGFELFSGGYVGVDVFFVISGYLITTIIINEMDEERFKLTTFYERRARRILPALVFVVLCSVPAAWLLLLPDDFKDFAQSIAAVATFSSNILFWLESGYFDTAAELKPLLHTWSLAVEEQFYIFFPLILMALWRFGRRVIIWALIAIFVVSLTAAHWGANSNSSAAFYLLHTRAWELMIGAFTGFYLQRRRLETSLPIMNALSALGLAAIVYAVLVFDHETPFPSLYALIPTLGTALIVLFAQRGTWVYSLLSMKGFVAIGLISYSLYLWHQPIFSFTRHALLIEPTPMQMLIGAAVSVGLATFTYFYVEAPFRGKASAFNRRQIFSGSALVLSGFMAFGLVTHVQAGFPHRFAPFAQLMSTTTESPKRDECHYGEQNRFPVEASCRYFADQPTSAVYGNSHGVELAYELAGVLSEREEGVHHFTVSGCDAAYGLETDPFCQEFFQSRLELMFSDDSIERVFLTFRSDLSGLESAQALMRLANELSHRGKEVVLVLQAPALHSDIDSYVVRLSLTGAPSGDVVSVSREDWRVANADIYGALGLLDREVKVVDLAEAFCDAEQCYAIRDGEALYFDDDHMSLAGARLASRHIATLME